MSCREPCARPGFTTVEVLVALSTGAILLAAIAAAITAVSRLERGAADRSERLAAHAHAATVLGHELRALDTRRDGFSIGVDSVRLRAFRGRAIVCLADSASAAVRYEGLRLPDPAKDSLLVLTGDGVERSLPLLAAAPAAVCNPGPGESGMEIRPGAGLAPGDVVLVHETGAYHLSGGALRYRRGAGGRQPLTPTVFVDAASGLVLSGVTLPAVRADTAAVRVRTTDAAAAGAVRFEVRLPFLNLAVALDSIPLR